MEEELGSEQEKCVFLTGYNVCTINEKKKSTTMITGVDFSIIKNIVAFSVLLL